MTATALKTAFSTWSATGQPLVLATVYDTEGSTYSKTGAHMLITGEATFQGMLSGGCLEGDLAERARQVVDTGQPQAVTYDLGTNDEELWGLGVGCDGLMRILLQPLLADEGYEPFQTIVTALDGETTELAATVVESNIDTLPVGSSLVTVNGKVAFSNIGSGVQDDIWQKVRGAFADPRSRTMAYISEQGEATILLSALTPPPKVLVLGAGLDAAPVVRFALELGWRVTVQDHRPAYIESGDFSAADHVLCVPVEGLSSAIDLGQFEAVIVMSHHLVSDRQYLAQLADTDIDYIGLLGPVDRRRRLLRDLGEKGKQLEGRVHGPAGLAIGGRGPAAIALSIIAEMHQELMVPLPD